MTTPRLDLSAQASDSAVLRRAFDAIRERMGVVTDFPPEVERQARAAVGGFDRPDRDETAVPFVTIDPPGSTDLDQALYLSREGRGFRLRYAIADVPAFVVPGSALDAETRKRVQTYYLPDGRAPLHPTVLSEGEASLLPGCDRPAYVWDVRLDPQGEPTGVDLERAMVRSVARLDYPSVQAQLDSGRTSELLRLLETVGRLRLEREADRNGASLALPDQEVTEQDGRFVLSYRPVRPVEDYNAQISLLTGMVAASTMIEGGTGILRTMPPPPPEAVEDFRRQAAALGITWPTAMPYGAFLHGLDVSDPRHLALVHQAAQLFRGAGYTAFAGQPPDQPVHAAVAAPYAHVTAPLRRLVDRFGLVTCHSLRRGVPVPEWVTAALSQLPEVMAAGDRSARAVERACTDAVEAAVLAELVGCEVEAVVVGTKGTEEVLVQMTEPAVLAKARGAATAGHRVRVRVDGADVDAGTVQLTVVAR